MTTGTAFDFARIDVPCPKCGKASAQPISELVSKKETTCSYWGAGIDLSTEAWQTRLREEADIFKKIMHPSRL